MRKHLLFVLASLFLVAGTVHAQSVTLKADIPFDFVVDNTIMARRHIHDSADKYKRISR